jgi:hypothetical protein
MDRLLLAWQEAVFSLYLSEGKIEPEVVDNMQSWEYSGFSVDQAELLFAGETPLPVPVVTGCGSGSIIPLRHSGASIATCFDYRHNGRLH